jgi:hypothetical protein
MPGTVVTSYGTAGASGAWTNPSKAEGAPDGNYATLAGFVGASTPLIIPAPFSIPVGATINSLTVSAFIQGGAGSYACVLQLDNGVAAWAPPTAPRGALLVLWSWAGLAGA